MNWLTYSSQWLIILLSFVALQAQSQTTEAYTYPPSEVMMIHSKVLNEDRKVYVHCPKLDSATLNKRFPVLYLMDGDNHFELLAQYVNYLSRTDVLAIPPIIVVGISNTNRTRDLTPTNSVTDYSGKPDSSSYKLSGGNESFLRFIGTELIPMIDNHYKTEPYRIFAGHSFGGLSSLNCLLTYPDMFDAYIAVSPSLWWNKGSLLEVIDKKLKTGTILNKMLFCSDGNEGGSNSSFHKGLLKLDSLIAKKKLKKLGYMYKLYSTETHMTAPVVAYFDALRFIFKEWEQHR